MGCRALLAKLFCCGCRGYDEGVGSTGSKDAAPSAPAKKPPVYVPPLPRLPKPRYPPCRIRGTEEGSGARVSPPPPAAAVAATIDGDHEEGVFLGRRDSRDRYDSYASAKSGSQQSAVRGKRFEDYFHERVTRVADATWTVENLNRTHAGFSVAVADGPGKTVVKTAFPDFVFWSDPRGREFSDSCVILDCKNYKASTLGVSQVSKLARDVGMVSAAAKCEVLEAILYVRNETRVSGPAVRMALDAVENGDDKTDHHARRIRIIRESNVSPEQVGNRVTRLFEHHKQKPVLLDP